MTPSHSIMQIRIITHVLEFLHARQSAINNDKDMKIELKFHLPGWFPFKAGKLLIVIIGNKLFYYLGEE